MKSREIGEVPVKRSDTVQSHALRLCLGAFRTLPASSMCVQANEPPLYIRRRMLSIQYSIRLGSSPSNPAYSTFFSPKFKAAFSSKPNQIPTLGIRIAPELEKIGFKRNKCKKKLKSLKQCLTATRPTSRQQKSKRCYYFGSTSP